MGTPPISTTKLTKSKVNPPTLADATEIQWHRTRMKMYGISDSKLEELTASYNSLYLFFAGVCLGAFVSLFIGLRTTTVEADKPLYLSASITTAVLGLFFGIMGIYNYLKASSAKKKLYQESIPIDPKLSNSARLQT